MSSLLGLIIWYSLIILVGSIIVGLFDEEHEAQRTETMTIEDFLDRFTEDGCPVQEVTEMVTSDGYTLYQSENKIIIGLPQTWETLDCSVSPIVDRQRYLTTEQEMCLLAIVKEFMRSEKNG